MKIQILHIKMKCTGFLTLLARIPKYNFFAKGPLIFGDEWLENLGKQPKQGNLLFYKLGSGEFYQGILASTPLYQNHCLGFPHVRSSYLLKLKKSIFRQNFVQLCSPLLFKVKDVFKF